MPGGGSPVRRRTSRPELRCAFLALPVALFGPDMRELSAEQYDLRGVVDPDQDDDDRGGRAIRRFKSLLADVKADQELADLEQRRPCRRRLTKRRATPLRRPEAT
jgi:hypothetical protein